MSRGSSSRPAESSALSSSWRAARPASSGCAVRAVARLLTIGWRGLISSFTRTGSTSCCIARIIARICAVGACSGVSARTGASTRRALPATSVTAPPSVSLSHEHSASTSSSGSGGFGRIRRRLVELHVLAGDGHKFLAVELAQAVEDVIIQRFVGEEHLQPARLEGLQIRAGLDGRTVRRDLVINRPPGPSFMRVTIVGQSGQLAGVLQRRLEPQQPAPGCRGAGNHWPPLP